MLTEIVMTTPLDEFTEVRRSDFLTQASEYQLLADRSDGEAKQQYEELARRLVELALAAEGPR